MCNLLAMTYLQQEDFAMVLELLKKAEILTERDNAGRAVTFNNLACYYRRQGKLHAALQYLQKALKIENKLEVVDNPADTVSFLAPHTFPHTHNCTSFTHYPPFTPYLTAP